VVAEFLKAGRIKLLWSAAAMIVSIAIADWCIGTRASLGPLYIVPMMLAATVLPEWQIVVLAFACSTLREWFDLPSPVLEKVLRFVFAVLSYAVAGMFVRGLIRNRELVLEHLVRIRREQDLRRELEEQLRILVDSSPAAIFTVDAAGAVLAANRAANQLFMASGESSLKGRAVKDYVPLLAGALELPGGAEGFRAAAQCQGRRENGEIFQANTWFSSYSSPEGVRLAAIVVDSSEEMRDREEQALAHLIEVNRVTTAAVFHEVRNLSAAIAVLCSNLTAHYALMADDDFRGLTTLVDGLEHIASAELRGVRHEDLDEVALEDILNDLRIVIEPGWREVNGMIEWTLPSRMPRVRAGRHGLFQVLLNLAQNSLRAVQECPERELHIEATVAEGLAIVRFRDTGSGVAEPERLFAPFTPAANGSGLGLYVSRAMMRSYGGELRWEPRESGACFRVEIPIA
jgi:signal transduction histidine kinase